MKKNSEDFNKKENDNFLLFDESIYPELYRKKKGNNDNQGNIFKKKKIKK